MDYNANMSKIFNDSFFVFSKLGVVVALLYLFLSIAKYADLANVCGGGFCDASDFIIVFPWNYLAYGPGLLSDGSSQYWMLSLMNVVIIYFAFMFVQKTKSQRV